MRRLCVLLFTLSLATPVAAQTILANTDIGWLAHEGNETTDGAKNADPAKFRLTTPINDDGGGGGVVSFNASRIFGQINFGNNQLEMGMLRVEQAEDARHSSSLKAEFNFLLNDGSGQDDQAMRKPLAFTWNQVTRFEPALAASFAAHLAPYLSGGSGTPSRMADPENRYWLQLQSDSNYVIYDAIDPEHPKAIFDLWWLMGALAELGKHYPR